MANLGEANIGGRMVPAWLLDLTAEELDSLKSRWYNNPNLLDNWYFGNPVNQRGQTNYGGYSYGIDRWIVEQGTILVSENGITLTPGTVIDQYLDWTIDSERMCTISVLCDEVVYALNRTKDSESNWHDAGGSIWFRFSHLNGKDIISFANNAQTNKTIVAVKLELGPTQTLSHLENGNWVLNEVPDYGEQLARCQRYFTKIPYSIGQTISTTVSDGNGEAFFPIYFPTTMRVTPVFTHTGILRIHGPGIEYRDVSISSVTTQGNIIVLRVVGLSPLTTYALDSTTGGVLNFSADL